MFTTVVLRGREQVSIDLTQLSTKLGINEDTPRDLELRGVISNRGSPNSKIKIWVQDRRPTFFRRERHRADAKAIVLSFLDQVPQEYQAQVQVRGIINFICEPGKGVTVLELESLRRAVAPPSYPSPPAYTPYPDENEGAPEGLP